MTNPTPSQTQKTNTLNELQGKIITAAQRLYARNLLAAGDGNISFRISDQEILITPAGKAKAFIEPEDIAVITIDNKIIHGNPSSERLMHLAVYQQCPQAQSVVHAHPPTAIAWSIAYPELAELPNACMSELIISVGSIPIVPYAKPGTDAMGQNLLPYLPQHRAMILARHGALTFGESLEEAVNGMERIEHSAEILWRAQSLGGLTYLDDQDVAELKALRTKLGEKIL